MTNVQTSIESIGGRRLVVCKETFRDQLRRLTPSNVITVTWHAARCPGQRVYIHRHVIRRILAISSAQRLHVISA